MRHEVRLHTICIQGAYNPPPSNVDWNMRTLMVPVLPAEIARLPKPVLELTGSRFQY